MGKYLAATLLLLACNIAEATQSYNMNCKLYHSGNYKTESAGVVLLGTQTAVVKVAKEMYSMPLIAESNSFMHYATGSWHTMAFTYPNNTGRIETTGRLKNGDDYDCTKELRF